MNSKVIYPSTISGRLVAPASKSMMLRALTVALLADGISVLEGYTPCDDTENAIRVIERLGAKVTRSATMLEVVGCPPHKLQAQPLVLHCGESGLLSRMLASVGTLYTNDLRLIGEGSLVNRPFGASADYFNQLGLQQVASNENTILHVQGELNASQVHIDGSGGSQLLSGLLMTLPLLPNDSVIEVENLRSKPYIDLTISALKAFGVEIVNNDYSRFLIKGGQGYHPCKYKVEGDWSGASCLLVAGAIGGSVTVGGLDIQSLQADRAIVDVLKKCGARLSIVDSDITVSRERLQSFEFDATHCPDLFPALVALASACNGTSCIKGVSRLRHKESDRAFVLQQEFAKLQVPIIINDDIMEVTGADVQGGEVVAHNDHRIAMALAVAGINAKMAVKIDGVECVAKSYPTFFDDLERLQQV